MTDRALILCASEFREGILKGRSSSGRSDISSALAALLRFLGARVMLIEGSVDELKHAWVELEDGRILDATADQFGRKPVYLGPKPYAYLVERRVEPIP